MTPIDAGTTADLLCVHCGYDLRGLDADDRCPECGTEVAISMHGDRLAAADPGWLRQLVRGQRLITYGCLIWWISVPVLILVEAWLGTVNASALVQNLVGYLVTSTALLMILGGIIGITTLDPRLTLSEQPMGLRRAARALAIGALGVMVVSVGLEFSTVAAPAVMRLAFWLFITLLAGSAVVASYYMGRLARRVPDDEIARDAPKISRRFMWCLMTGLVLMNLGSWMNATTPSPRRGATAANLITLAESVGTIAVFGALLFGVALMATWWNFRKVLSSCLRQAESTGGRAR